MKISNRIALATTSLALLSLLASSAAQAHDNGRVNWSVNIGIPVYAPSPVYVESPPVYYAPQPVYVQPAPVIVRTRPVFAPYPVIYAPYPQQVVRHEWRHHRGRHSHYRD